MLDQLSPYEIELLTLLFSENQDQNYPLASIKKILTVGYTILYKDIPNISFKNFPFDTISVMLSNLERVGVINIDHAQFIEPDETYNYLTNSDLYIRIEKECEKERTDTNLPYPKCMVDKHMFCLTKFGKSFVTTVIG